MLENPINQFSAFLPAFEFMPMLARFIFLLPTQFLIREFIALK
jgi:hypothetical protein